MSPPELTYFYITLVRHGETYENKTQIIQGHLDTILSPVGENQAKRVCEAFENLHVDAMFASDLSRAYGTAEAIHKSHKSKKIPLYDNSLMRERNFGINNGKPRKQIHDFIAMTKAHHDGCRMWRECKGECGHQIFWRALNFFFDLCHYAANRTPQETPTFPELNTTTPLNKSDRLPLLLPLRSPPVPDAFTAPPHRLASGGVKGNIYQGMKYAGHFVLVSHGQWIREFTHVLNALAEQTLGFPSQQSMLAVLSNCQFNQFGVVIRPHDMAARADHFRTLVQTMVATFPESPKDARAQGHRRSWRCPYELESFGERLPMSTVCYHARLDAETVQGHMTTAPEPELRKQAATNYKQENVAPTAGSGAEMLYFAREDDEYAGLPTAK